MRDNDRACKFSLCISSPVLEIKSRAFILLNSWWLHPVHKRVCIIIFQIHNDINIILVQRNEPYKWDKTIFQSYFYISLKICFLKGRKIERGREKWNRPLIHSLVAVITKSGSGWGQEPSTPSRFPTWRTRNPKHCYDSKCGFILELYMCREIPICGSAVMGTSQILLWDIGEGHNYKRALESIRVWVSVGCY